MPRYTLFRNGGPDPILDADDSALLLDWEDVMEAVEDEKLDAADPDLAASMFFVVKDDQVGDLDAMQVEGVVSPAGRFYHRDEPVALAIYEVIVATGEWPKDPMCPACGLPDVGTWAEDGEADEADYAECNGCGWKGSGRANSPVWV